MSTVKNIKTEEEFNKIKDKGIYLIFSAAWCGPCRMMAPVYEKIAAKNPEIEVIKVDVDISELRDLRAKFGVRSIPAMFFINKKGEIKGLTGAQGETLVQEEINKIK